MTCEHCGNQSNGLHLCIPFDYTPSTSDVEFAAFYQQTTKDIALGMAMHGNVYLDAADSMRRLGGVMWHALLTEQFGEHPPRIFHEGP